VTFRVRLVRSRTTFFTPSQLPGCVLWLRSDLGVTGSPVASGSISAWSDQSGQGNNATVPAGTVPYSPNTGINGFPVIGSTGNTDVLTGTFTGTFGSSHTIFNVNGYTSGGAGAAAFAGTDNNFDTHTGFAQYFSGDPNTIIGEVSNTNTHITQATSTATPSTMNTGAIYSTAGNSSSVDLYINGSSVASSTVAFTPESPTNYLVLALAYPAGVVSSPLANVAYEFIVYNRVLSAAERIVVHRYLGGRYGISVP
jgi:hypothetical protein